MSTTKCALIGGNTGGTPCGWRRQTPVVLIVGGKEFTYEEYADADTFQDALIAATQLQTGNSSKLFAFPVINDIAVNTESDSTGSLNLGPVVRLKKGRPAYTFTMQDLPQDQYMNLLAFDNKTLPAFIFDDAGQVVGYRGAAVSNTINQEVFKGQRALITVSGNGFKDGANVATGQATVSVSFISIDDFDKRAAAITLPNLSSGDLEGLREIMLSKLSSASNVYKIKTTISTSDLEGGLDVYDDYSAALVGLTWTAWTGTGYATTLPVTSVTVDATTKSLVFTFDTTAFGLLVSGAKIKLIPPTVVALDAVDISPFEIFPVILTK